MVGRLVEGSKSFLAGGWCSDVVGAAGCSKFTWPVPGPDGDSLPCRQSSVVGLVSLDVLVASSRILLQSFPMPGESTFGHGDADVSSPPMALSRYAFQRAPPSPVLAQRLHQ